MKQTNNQSLEKRLSGSHYFCPYPWSHIEIRNDLSVGLCPCGGWLPESIGNLGDDTSLDDIYNSEKAKLIRESVLDGSFAFCDPKRCHFLQLGLLPKKDDILSSRSMTWNHTEVSTPEIRDILKYNITMGFTPKFYQLSYDESCNISCPSCRSKVIRLDKGDDFQKKKDAQKKIHYQLSCKPIDKWAIVNVSGIGDPFASKLYLELLETIDGYRYPKLMINFQTNGLLFNPQNWDRLHNIQSNFNDIIVSCDAATTETYKVVRRGGNWSVLQKNLRFIAGLRKTRKIKGQFRLDYVVQKRNFREMRDFVQMANDLGVDAITFHAIQPFFLHSEISSLDTYADHAVWLPEHHDYHEYLKIMRDPIFEDEKIYFELMSPCRPKPTSLVSHREDKKIKDMLLDVRRRLGRLKRGVLGEMR